MQDGGGADTLPSLELRELVKLHGSRTHDNEEPLSYDEVMMM